MEPFWQGFRFDLNSNYNQIIADFLGKNDSTNHSGHMRHTINQDWMPFLAIIKETCHSQWIASAVLN